MCETCQIKSREIKRLHEVCRKKDNVIKDAVHRLNSFQAGLRKYLEDEINHNNETIKDIEMFLG